MRAAAPALALAALLLALGAPAARAELDDPEFHRAMMLLQGGDGAGAAAALAEPLQRRAGELYVLEAAPEPDRARIRALQHELASLHGYLAIASQRAGRGEQAIKHLEQLLALDPAARLDPLETPRPLLLELEELRAKHAAPAATARIEIAAIPVPGIEHVPPLLVVKGSEATIYVRVTGAADARVTVDYCAASAADAPACATPRRATLTRIAGEVHAGTLAAASAAEESEIRYRLGVVDGAGRSRSTPWYALAVVRDVPSHLAGSERRYGPRAQALLHAATVEVRLAPQTPLPEGIREVDSRRDRLEHRQPAY